MIKNKKTAFTLMETLITVVILGIVAAILVPNLINRQVENANRTKVKKAMAAYEKAINYIILENDIKSTEELKEFGEEENCKFSKAYFKTVQDGANDCIFKTADRVWWDISDLTNPILILKDSQKDKTKTELQTLAKNVTDKTVFSMVGRFDDLGTLRINDNAYEQTYGTTDQRKYVGKLWYFITQSTSVLTGIQKCQAEGAKICTVKIGNENIDYEQIFLESTNSEYYVKKYPSQTYTSDDAKSENNCKTSMDPDRCATDGDYWNLANTTCQLQGTRLPNEKELRALYSQGVLRAGWSNNGSCGSSTNKWCAMMLYSNGNVTTNGKNSNVSFLCISD